MAENWKGIALSYSSLVNHFLNSLIPFVFQQILLNSTVFQSYYLQIITALKLTKI